MPATSQASDVDGAAHGVDDALLERWLIGPGCLMLVTGRSHA
jgi:hypothetical protein